MFFNALRAALLAAVMMGGAVFATASSSVSADATPQPAAVKIAAIDGDAVYKGDFRGVEGKQATGSFEIFRDGDRTLIRLSDDFSLTRVPDPKLSFGNGAYVDGTTYALLTSFNGEQVYEIPSHLNPAAFSQVWIWCEEFSVPLAVAEIGPSAA
ncbi:MAG: DM13 domain-containing protein [Pseudomonadota bacterium]